jgi:hypothetical protein
MKAIKLKTNVQIKFNKKGNIKSIKTPYDNDSIINEPIFSNSIENHNTLLKVFKSFGESYLMNFNN